MVCPYCRSDTKVTNSRPQKRQNQVWRRRQCLKCQAGFTTHEKLAFSGTIRLQTREGQLVPFQPEKLLISLYDSCRHRPDAVSDATALADTCLAKISRQINGGVITRAHLVKIAYEVLRRFDKAASVHYKAFHKISR